MLQPHFHPHLYLLPLILGALEVSSASLAAYSSIPPNSLLANDLCSFDVVVVVYQPGLTLDDLYAIPSSSPLSSRFQNAPWKQFSERTLNVEYSDLLKSIQDTCGQDQDLVEFHPSEIQGAMVAVSEFSRPSIISFPLPELTEEGGARKEVMSSIASELADDLQVVEDVFASHLVMFAGSLPCSLPKRSLGTTADSPFFSRQVPPANPTHGNSSLPQGGILKRYQLLTPGLLTSLFIILLVFLPILLVGISALSSIKVPQRTDNPNKDRKGY